MVIPCYNYGRYLPAAVGSVLAQGVPVEVVIVDDASTDDSRRVAQQLAARDERVRVLAHARNTGHIQTYNDGLATVTGDFVALLSADDLVAPGAFRRALSVFTAHPDVALLYGPVEEFTTQAPAPGAAQAWGYHVWAGDDWLAQACRLGGAALTSPEAIVRRHVLDAVGGYRADLPHTADMYYWLRSAALGRVARTSGPAQAYYRLHGGNMHTTRFAGLADLGERRRTLDLPELALSARRRRAADRAITAEALWAGIEAASDGDVAYARACLAFVAGAGRRRAWTPGGLWLRFLTQRPESAWARRQAARIVYHHWRAVTRRHERRWRTGRV